MLHISFTALPEGRQLRIARVAANLTIWEVAQRADVQPPRISEHERGRGRLSPEALARVHQVLAEQLADSQAKQQELVAQTAGSLTNEAPVRGPPE